MRKSRSKTKTYARVNERKFPFVVQIAVPDGGFGCTLDAINAWHFYSKNWQRLGRRLEMGEQQFWRWCFEKHEIAELFRQRFGGEMVPLVVRQYAKIQPHSAAPAGVEKDDIGAAGDRDAQKDERKQSTVFVETFNQNGGRPDSKPDSPFDRC
jgi:hypothetical protein